jgi:hypothetical protein
MVPQVAAPVATVVEVPVEELNMLHKTPIIGTFIESLSG